MLLTLLKVAVVMTVLPLAWFTIDRAWRRSFPENEDMSFRCRGCSSCTSRCQDHQEK